MVEERSTGAQRRNKNSPRSTDRIDEHPSRQSNHRLLIEFWDTTKVVFKVFDCKLTPTLEEVTSFTELPFTRQKTILSVIIPAHEFLHALGLTSKRNLRNVEDGWVSMDQLFDRFGHRESYEWHLEEF